MFLYPESSQSDYVREMSELDTFNDVFYVGRKNMIILIIIIIIIIITLVFITNSQMLIPNDRHPNPPLDWDDEGHYTATSVEVWFQEYLVITFPENEASADVESLRHHFNPQVSVE